MGRKYKRVLPKNILSSYLYYFLSCISPLSVAYYIETLSYQDTLHFLYLSLDLCLGLYILFVVIYFDIIIFIFITINHIISLMQTNLFLRHVYQKFSLRMLFSFCLNFCQFQPGIDYKVVAYKKKRVNE